MIERQGGNGRTRFAARERTLYPCRGLQDIGYHIAVTEHGTFGNAGGPAGVLQKGEIIMAEGCGLKGKLAALA